MLTNKPNGTLYMGSISQLQQRVWQHKEGLVEGFTQSYGVSLLVWYEVHVDAYAMVTRERQIKEWQREWKLRLIREMNPMWRDLYEQLTA